MVEPSWHPTAELTDADLLTELDQVLRGRLETLRHGSDAAVANSARRLAELEDEYVRRFPDREVQPERLRPAR